MIRAVSRYTLEINRTGSPYFERAICFVRPEFTQSDRVDLHKAAQQLIAAIDSGVEEQAGELEGKCTVQGEAESDRGARLQAVLRRALPLFLSGVIGAGIAVLITLLVV